MVGINKASFYYYFKNKEAIFADLITREADGYIEAQKAKVDSITGCRDKILTWIREGFKYDESGSILQRLSRESLKNVGPQLAGLKHYAKKKGEEFLASVLAEGRKNGEITANNPGKIARIIQDVVYAMKDYTYQYFRPGWDPKERNDGGGYSNMKKNMINKTCLITGAKLILVCRNADRLHWITASLRIGASIGLSGPIPRHTNYEDTGGPFFLDREGTRPDPIEDDLALWIETESGLIVCAGCSHAGIVNTLDYIRSLNRGTRIRALIGGFHLKDASESRIEKTAEVLAGLHPDHVVPCHCTGNRAVAVLRSALGGIVSTGTVGGKIEL